MLGGVERSMGDLRSFEDEDLRRIAAAREHLRLEHLATVEDMVEAASSARRAAAEARAQVDRAKTCIATSRRLLRGPP